MARVPYGACRLRRGSRRYSSILNACAAVNDHPIAHHETTQGCCNQGYRASGRRKDPGARSKGSVETGAQIIQNGKEGGEGGAAKGGRGGRLGPQTAGPETRPRAKAQPPKGGT